MKLFFFKKSSRWIFSFQDAAVVLFESWVKTGRDYKQQMNKDKRKKKKSNQSDDAEHLFFQNILLDK